MKNISYGTIILLIFALIGSIVVLIGILKFLANSHIKRKRARLFDASYPLSGECLNLSKKIEVQYDKFNQYIENLGLNQEYECSSSVVSKAKINKVKYLIKYSKINDTVSCMEKLDFCIDYLETLENFWMKMDQLSDEVRTKLPWFCRLFVSRKKVSFFVCDLGKSYEKLEYPEFVFSYTSPAGKSWRDTSIVITSKRLMKVRSEISLKMTKAGHTKVQRGAMTNDLREAIKKRDNYTCCNCGNSVLIEPNLLLEVDHIIPVAKGGITEASNLQTLCWRCNRAKGDK